MIVSINQPAYLPWLGYYNRIVMSDIHVVLDHVQFEKNSFINRNKILSKEEPSWLTVPVMTKGKFGNIPINKVEILNIQNWPKKHLENIRHNYKKAPFFDIYFPFFEKIYSKQWMLLADLIKEINKFILNCLKIETPIIYSSELSVGGTKSELVLNLCKEMNATTYLSGTLGKNYLDENSFSSNNIKVVYHDYEHPEYQQIYSPFHPYLSIIDLIFNHGEESAEIIKKGFIL